METDDILSEIENFVTDGDLTELDVYLKLLQNSTIDFEASKLLTAILLKNFTHYKADYLAEVMGRIIRANPNLAIVNHPENFLFRVAVLKGSLDLYECYMEEGFTPYLENIDSDEHEEQYNGLLETAKLITGHFFEQYGPCVKGLDYNGAFTHINGNENHLVINKDDYETMEEVVERYNTIVGRKEIIKDLATKAGFIKKKA